jgi:UDP-N-acetylmuramoyl-tripeptide--D-alanyl-D-alanine ligase
VATPIPRNSARFTLSELAEAMGGHLAHEEAGPDVVAGVTTDSRAVEPGALFVALRGESLDGHAFVASAGAAGARAVLVERGASFGDAGAAAVIEVDDTLVAWGALAKLHLERWRRGDAARRVVAITGSAGKTTTKELAAALLAEVGPTHYTAGNLNNRVGVPAVVLGLDDQRYAVLEMGMSLQGELDAIAGFARPDVSVVVNVGVAHAEGVGGREGVMHEKGAVYRALGATGIAVVNADDPFVVRAAELAGAANRVTFGRAEGADYRLVDRAGMPDGGSRLEVVAKGRKLTVELPLPGEAAALDFVAALAAGEAASGAVLGREAVQRALGRVRVEGRGSLLRLGDVVVIDDTYNANPASMRAGLATLAEIAESVKAARRVAILGEMKELGRLAEEEHRALGDAVADASVELLVGCGGLVTLALERARLRGVTVVDAPDAPTAALEAVRLVRPGDVVLVKASRGVRAERVVEALRDRFRA